MHESFLRFQCFYWLLIKGLILEYYFISSCLGSGTSGLRYLGVEVPQGWGTGLRYLRAEVPLGRGTSGSRYLGLRYLWVDVPQGWGTSGLKSLGVEVPHGWEDLRVEVPHGWGNLRVEGTSGLRYLRSKSLPTPFLMDLVLFLTIWCYLSCFYFLYMQIVSNKQTLLKYILIFTIYNNIKNSWLNILCMVIRSFQLSLYKPFQTIIDDIWFQIGASGWSSKISTLPRFNAFGIHVHVLCSGMYLRLPIIGEWVLTLSTLQVRLSNADTK